MEAKLAAYRRQKEEEKRAEQSLINKLKLVITNRSKEPPGDDDHERTENSRHISDDIEDLKALERSELIPGSLRKSKQYIQNTDHQEDEEAAADSTNLSLTKKTIVKIIFWLAAWGLFIILEFGAVFFTVSVIIFMYFNTRTGPKDNKPSAYSVFNQDCERIQGTLTAEQMQKHMFSVPGLPS